MTEGARYPTMEEFWRRLHKRAVEPDLVQQLRERTGRESGSVRRVGRELTVVAVMERLMPGAPVPTKALAVFVDENFDRRLGRGDERAGLLPLAELIPAGFTVLDTAVGGSFASVDTSQQDDLLQQAERGRLMGPDGFESAAWFHRLRGIALLAFGSDPRGMVHMGYPGPSYQPGHLWLDRAAIAARVRRKKGYLTF